MKFYKKLRRSQLKGVEGRFVVKINERTTIFVKDRKDVAKIRQRYKDLLFINMKDLTQRDSCEYRLI